MDNQMDSQETKIRWQQLGAVFGVALFVRLAYLMKAGSPPTPDSPSYFQLGENLVRHGIMSFSANAPYMPTSLRPPVYPLFLGIFRSLLGLPIAGVAAVQCALDAVVAVIMVRLASRVMSLRFALLTGFVYAFSPGSIVYSTKIMAEMLFTFECAVAVMMAVIAVERKCLHYSVGAGAMFAVATLTRPLGALLIPLTMLMLAFFWYSAGNKRWLAPALACALAAGALILPWSVRCTLLAGR